jgi:glycosyltransferase involved in cell wall biosynthesis
LGLFSTLSAQCTDVVVTVSEFSKKSICSSLNIPGEKVRVVPSGPGWSSERPSCSDVDKTLLKYGIARPYVAAFAGGYPHKNIPRLMTAFQTACRDLPHELVLIGRLPPNVAVASPLVKAEFKERIRLVGHIPSDDIYPILGGSEMFVFPSLYEGFGFPLLEAQAAGAAVACSNIASIPEVAGNGAVYFDPLSVDSMSRTLRSCLESVTLRNRLVELGNEKRPSVFVG